MNPSSNQSVNQSINQSINPKINQLIKQNIKQSINKLKHLLIIWSINQSIKSFDINPSIHQSIKKSS